jgi:dimeric dUTPase (all-alpha-NTP-PPase superfamily)
MNKLPYPTQEGASLPNFSNQLAAMMAMQKAFQCRVDPRCFSLDYKERAAFIRDHTTYCVQELGEMLQEVPFYKHWKDYSKLSDEDTDKAYNKAKEELIDAWHFFMNLAIGLGMDPDDFYAIYMGKHQENIRRQDEGYIQEGT